jgi:hypothetical protein
VTMLHALPSSALTSIWMSLILKLFASDSIFASHNLRSVELRTKPPVMLIAQAERVCAETPDPRAGPPRTSRAPAGRESGSRNTLSCIRGCRRTSHP